MLFPHPDPYWGSTEGRIWLETVFLLYYDALPFSRQLEYCARWNAPQAWVTMFLHPQFDAAAYEADEGLDQPQPINFRMRLLGF